ncbi:MAG: hypothetical protein AUF79_04220 [Crenarchaeota archaeon 13_1_20CM_2_51_8]|nr:MAG: hypothetical protein AUF79_04220 [Crenarchaeota archaeon 13_1_20CM_2_51_8]
MNRRRAQLFLLVITVPIVLAVVYSVYSIWNGYGPSLELILGVGGGVFIEAFLATLIASKRSKKKPRPQP